jgi:hypothetical protein
MKTFGFKEIEEKKLDEVGHAASATCSGGRSDCCTRVCTKCPNTSEEEGSLESWNNYLEVEAGVLQY